MRAYLVDILAVGFFILDLAPAIRLQRLEGNGMLANRRQNPAA
jgi:hypothetical protein